MKTEKILKHLIKPLVLSGAYKDETVALKDIVISQIESKIKTYDRIIKTYQKKYGKNFDTFSKKAEKQGNSRIRRCLDGMEQRY